MILGVPSPYPKDLRWRFRLVCSRIRQDGLACLVVAHVPFFAQDRHENGVPVVAFVEAVLAQKPFAFETHFFIDMNGPRVVLEDVEPDAVQVQRLEPVTHERYEVEVQLGKSDEAHIIRTIEYWDIERKRYPQYDHTAVIVAEDITTRFLNVIALFNGSIPLVAIQMNAVKLGEHVSLVCSTVLGEVRLGLVDEDEEVQEVTDRAYWEKRGSKITLGLADELHNRLRP